MARLRVRIELNRRLAGVPLEKMASVIDETRKFFQLLAEDVRMDGERGEWLASDFDPESLNFTAEYAGAVTAEQARAFGAAFSGATSLRKVTIAQFTRIAEFLGEDELVGFGLYQSDQDTEPTEWRCLSKRDALRFGEEIKLLAEAAGEQAPETQLPAVMNASVAGRRLFKDRREEVRRDREALAVDPSRLLREMESNLSRRIGQLEGEVAEQTRKLQQIGGSRDQAEERFQKLLAAMETFWAQAPRQLPLLLSAPAAPTMPAAPAPAQAEATSPPNEAPVLEMPVQKTSGWSVLGVSIAAGVAILSGLAFPAVQGQWSRFTSMEIMPTVKPKAPAPPVLPVVGVVHKDPEPAPPVLPVVGVVHKDPEPAPPVAKAVAARTSEPFVGPLIPLDVPAPLKPKIQSEVRVDVVVAIDREGKVTGAHVASTKGDRADLLVTEALRAAKQSRFRPAREGAQTVQSEMILSFLFKPEANEF